jgi:ATP-dependent exoDNAse (exonuclease V) beta subunit
MTRAKARLYVSGANGRPSKSGIHLSSPYLKTVRSWALEQGVSPEALAFGESSDAQTSRAAGRTAEHAAERREAALTQLRRRLERGVAAAGSSTALPPRTLSYTAISTYAYCPRLARLKYLFRLPDLRDDAETPLWTAEGQDPHADKLPPAAFGTLVHRVLELSARARIAGTAHDVEAFVAQALQEEERAAEPALVQRVLATARHGIERLAELTPREAELRFDATIADVRIGGFIDLLADDAAGRPVVIDYKTGHTPESAYRLQLSLYRRVLRDRFGESLGIAILRLAPDAASYTEFEPLDDAEVDDAVRAAARLDDDTPRPSLNCRSCAYAGPLCLEGAAAAEGLLVRV